MGRRTSSPACSLQAAQEPRVPLSRLVVPDSEAQSLPLPDYHQQPLGAGNTGVDEVSLEKHVMLHGDRDDHRWELRALRLVDGDCVRQRDFVQLPEVARHQPVVESDGEFLFDGIDPLDGADVAVEHFLLVAVLGLDDLVTDLEPPSKSLNGGLSGPNRVQSTLEHSVQFADSVHRPLVESPLSVVSVSPIERQF